MAVILEGESEDMGNESNGHILSSGSLLHLLLNGIEMRCAVPSFSVRGVGKKNPELRTVPAHSPLLPFPLEARMEVANGPVFCFHKIPHFPRINHPKNLEAAQTACMVHTARLPDDTDLIGQQVTTESP